MGMTMVEKIIARHAVVDAERGTLGVDAVKPGDALFVVTEGKVDFFQRGRKINSLGKDDYFGEVICWPSPSRPEFPNPASP